MCGAADASRHTGAPGRPLYMALRFVKLLRARQMRPKDEGSVDGQAITSASAAALWLSRHPFRVLHEGSQQWPLVNHCRQCTASHALPLTTPCRELVSASRAAGHVAASAPEGYANLELFNPTRWRTEGAGIRVQGIPLFGRNGDIVDGQPVAVYVAIDIVNPMTIDSVPQVALRVLNCKADAVTDVRFTNGPWELGQDRCL
jgi:hypothetical protein